MERSVFEASAAARRATAERMAQPMFVCSLLFLAIVAANVVLFVDVPRVHVDAAADSARSSQGTSEGTGDESLDLHSAEAQQAMWVGERLFILLCVLWSLFPLEFLVQWCIRDRRAPFWRHRYLGLAACLCPPLRLSVPQPDRDGMVWLPRLGWQQVDYSLRLRLEKALSVPMILIALMILPVLLLEFGMTSLVGHHFWLRTLLHVCTGIIWFAFAAEFIVMVSVAERKLRYCREHWLDLAIILLPLLSFLRTLRIIRLTRLARLARVQQLAKMSRLYRLRGLAMRALRALLLLELMNRILCITPEKKLRHLQRQLAEKEAELAILRREIEMLMERIASGKNPQTEQTASRLETTPERSAATLGGSPTLPGESHGD